MRTYLALSALSLAAALGCANVIGAGDYQVAGSGGTQTSAGGGGGQAGGTGWWTVGGSTGSGGKAGAGGATGGGGNASGGAGASAGGGIPDGGIGGSGKDASRADTGPLPGSNSGDITCDVTNPCPTGLNCEYMDPRAASTTGLCVLHCPAGNCDSSHICVSGGAQSSCLRDCSLTGLCQSAMTCQDLGGDAALFVCIPNAWVPATSAGVGDKCYSNSDCASGDCTSDGTTSGWCTAPCSATDNLCPGINSDMTNSYGEYNWCILNGAGDYKCFPGCSTYSPSSCSYYAGTACQSATDATGFATEVCATP